MYIDRCQEQIGANTLEKINGLVVAGIVVSRSQHLPESELDEKLGALLPPQLVEVVKKQAKLLPPDPLMEEVSTHLLCWYVSRGLCEFDEITSFFLLSAAKEYCIE